MNYYLNKHKEEKYIKEDSTNNGITLYTSKEGWSDLYIGNHLIFSYRLNNYTANDFPEKLHKHLFYEIDIFKKGKISYVIDKLEFFPSDGNIIIFPPNSYHTAHLIKDCSYERYVLYFSKKFFSKLHIKELPSLFSSSEACVRQIDHEQVINFNKILNKLTEMCQKKNKEDTILANALCFELLYLILNHSKTGDIDILPIPDYVCRVREYIDNNFQTINSVTELANELFYSREYMSRFFKKYYDLTVSEYLVRKKIDYAVEQINNGKSISYACDSCGFKSMSAFIHSFKTIKGMLPSKFKTQQ